MTRRQLEQAALVHPKLRCLHKQPYHLLKPLLVYDGSRFSTKIQAVAAVRTPERPQEVRAEGIERLILPARSSSLGQCSHPVPRPEIGRLPRCAAALARL